ncbi:hydrolase [Haladaptatus sp. R4]|uniref:alpha/beta fold hydrolase n=1 Tax=Haladaptatus sp. R4 TaxID=1679489 RepID=UPI0007B4F604|nr:alpha/beta hydrolase [Haladaptatus sp. R4]KZN26386.1 hydrolase [Haladaptatus sp. R4]
MQSVTSADGTAIAYERYGEGPPLVLLHGGSTHRYWEPLVPRFADDFTLVVPHRRGHGNSGDGGGYSLEREVTDVRTIIDTFDTEPIVFGHSFGGLLVIEAAREASIDRLIAYEPAVLVGEYRDRANLADRMQELLDAGERRDAMKQYVREVVHGGEIENFDTWLEAWPPWPGIVDLVENTVRMNRAIERYGLPDHLDVAAPTLLLTGTEGPPHLRESVRAVRDAVPNSRLVEFEGLGHGGPTEAPGRVVAEVRTFIDREK